MTEPTPDPLRLLALHALLEERHVTRAAQRLGVTQSTMSHRLRQLRAELGDPLLVRHGRGHVLTPRAEALLPRLTEAVAALDRVFAEDVPFEPRSARAEVTVALPDLLAPLLPAWMAELQREAPGLAVRIVAVPRDLDEALAEGRCWIAIAPASFATAATRSRRLGRLQFRVVVRAGHPLARRRCTLERWLAFPHVVVSVGNEAPNVIDRALEEQGRTRRIGLWVPNFLAGLFAVATSDLVMNAPMPLGAEVVRRLGVQVLEPPVDLPAISLTLLWHERMHGDRAHAWVRGRLYELAVAQLRGSA